MSLSCLGFLLKFSLCAAPFFRIVGLMSITTQVNCLTTDNSRISFFYNMRRLWSHLTAIAVLLLSATVTNLPLCCDSSDLSVATVRVTNAACCGCCGCNCAVTEQLPSNHQPVVAAFTVSTNDTSPCKEVVSLGMLSYLPNPTLVSRDAAFTHCDQFRSQSYLCGLTHSLLI